MTKFETWSLILTGIYDFLTFGLLSFVAHEALIKPRMPNIGFYLQRKPKDTLTWGDERQVVDFVLENKGVELKNIQITSDPDDLKWGMLRELTEDGDFPKPTSEYFNQIIPSLGRNEKLAFFWCDMNENADVVLKPFTIMVEFDDPVWGFRRCSERFNFDFSVFQNVAWGVNTRYDLHNVGQELARIREATVKLTRSVNTIAENQSEE